MCRIDTAYRLSVNTAQQINNGVNCLFLIFKFFDLKSYFIIQSSQLLK